MSDYCEHVGARCNDCIADAVSAVEAKHDQRLRDITAQAHEYADRHGLCVEFDRFMKSVGLEPRTRHFAVSVRVTVQIEIDIEARDEDGAAQSVDSYSVVDLARTRLAEYGPDDYEVTSVDEADD